MADSPDPASILALLARIDERTEHTMKRVECMGAEDGGTGCSVRPAPRVRHGRQSGRRAAQGRGGEPLLVHQSLITQWVAGFSGVGTLIAMIKRSPDPSGLLPLW
jgi:hypothetical protein